MRHRMTIATAAAVLFFACGGCATTGAYAEYDAGYDAGGPVPADVSFFYDDLAPYGTWFEMAGYGWCWSPYDVAVGWRPYTDGYWAYSDWGWTWASYEPWGWATFHYGRWAYDNFYGWVWVPGDVWAPAWVAWRYSPGWIGWAPLPPDVGWGASLTITATSYDYDRYLGDYDWCFVREGNFTDHRLRDRVLPASRNVTLIRRTRNVTNYREINSHPFNRGVDVTSLEGRLHHSVPRYRIESLASAPHGHGAEARGQTLRIYRPDVRHAPARRAAQHALRTQPPVSRAQFERRMEQDQRALDQRIANQRRRLQEEQQQEMRRRGANRTELRRQHQDEARAQQQLEQRERQSLQNRRERMQRWMDHSNQGRPGRDQRDQGNNGRRNRGQSQRSHGAG